jgi:hypothetical protein
MLRLATTQRIAPRHWTATLFTVALAVQGFSGLRAEESGRSARLHVESVAPEFPGVGDIVTLTGSGFRQRNPLLPGDQGSTVYFDGVAVRTGFHSSDAISFEIPEGATCGDHEVQVVNPGSGKAWVVGAPEVVELVELPEVPRPEEPSESGDERSNVLVVTVSGPCSERPIAFRRGEINHDGTLDVADPVRILGFLYLGDPAEIPCEKAADINDDGDLDLDDPIALLNSLFASGPKPAYPYGECGLDPTEDLLTCNSDPACER